MTNPYTQLLAPVIKAAGQELAGSVLANLTGMRITSGLRLPARCVLQFEDNGFSVSAGGTFTVGKEVRVETATGQVLFLGEVTGLEMDIDHSLPMLAVHVDDLSYRMTLGTKVRTFAQMSYVDVVRQIAGEYGLRPNITADGALSARQDYLLQSDSDFGFLDEVAERTGCDWWVQEKTLYLAPPKIGAAPVAQLTLGEDLMHFSVRASALHPGESTVRGWSPKLKQEVTATSRPGTVPVTDAAAFQGHLKPAALTSLNGAVTVADSPTDTAEASSLADGLAGRWQAGAVVARGTCWVAPAIAPGTTVAVAGAGPANGKYHVTEVEHSYSHRGFETRFTAGDRGPTGLVDTLGGGEPKASSFRRQGLVIGVVTAVGNPQGSVGTVKVKFTALGQVESTWARVVTIGGGTKRGLTFIPEINDEVVVAFEGGDVRRPLVMGGLFNGKDIAVDFGVDNGNVNRRRITSRLGHFVEFADGTQPSQQHVSMVLAGGQHSVRVGKDQVTATAPAGVPITITSGNSSVAIAQDGSITISGTKISIKATDSVDIQGLNINLKANVKLAASATMAEIKANATAEVSAGGPLMLKGAVVQVN